MPNPKKPRGNCLVCNKELKRPHYKYCSNICQTQYQYCQFIKDWLSGTVTGITSIGLVSSHIKRYLRKKYGDRCCLCNWSRINTKTGVVPLVANHIDGNWRNNIEKNLRLICPNCDSLSPTYAGSNRGNGRKGRVLSKRAQEGRLLIKNMPK